MNFAEFVTKYKNVNFDVFAFAYFKALEDLVGEEQAEKYVSNTIEEKQLVKDAAAVINKLAQTDVPTTIDDFFATSPLQYNDHTTYVSWGTNGIPKSSINTAPKKINRPNPYDEDCLGSF